MSSPTTSLPAETPPVGAVFATTHWSVVLSAGEATSPQSAAALETLCRAYWYPLYAHVRRLGRTKEDAEDLTQAFFAQLLAKNWLANADQERGRFRSFLLSALKHFLANEWDKVRAQKRGGGQSPLPLDTEAAERRYLSEPRDAPTPDLAYERRWALTLLDRTMTGLLEEFVAAGKEREFEHLKVCLTAEREGIPYAELAATLGQSEGALRVAVHRLRRRFRELFREQIAQTVAGPEEIDAEARYLMSALAG